MNRFSYYNPNPCGIITGDCVVRALSFFFGVTWRKAFLDIITWCADRGLVTFNFRSVYNKYLAEKGYQRHKAPEKGLSVARFIEEYAENGMTYIVSMPRHLTIVHDRVLYDLGDCSNKIMDGYWKRGGTK